MDGTPSLEGPVVRIKRRVRRVKRQGRLSGRAQGGKGVAAADRPVGSGPQVKSMSPVRSYLKAVFVGFDVLINAIFGGRPYQTLSCRVGESILEGGWASRIPWPRRLKRHFIDSVHLAVV